MRYLLLINLIILVGLQSCKKEQPQPSPFNQGCDCANEVNADFTIEEMGELPQFPPKNTVTDSIYGDKNVRFYAKEENAEYTWYIGAEILHTREVKRYFDNSLVGQTIPITLVIKKAANQVCFPNDDGYDSIIKQFVVAEEFNMSTFYQNPNPRIEGVFRLKDINGSDSVDVTIEILAPGESGPGAFSMGRINIYNLDGNGSVKLCDGGTAYNYRQIWFSASGYQSINLHHKMDGTVELDFKPYEGVSDPDYFFKGRKIS